MKRMKSWLMNENRDTLISNMHISLWVWPPSQDAIVANEGVFFRNPPNKNWSNLGGLASATYRALSLKSTKPKAWRSLAISSSVKPPTCGWWRTWWFLRIGFGDVSPVFPLEKGGQKEGKGCQKKEQVEEKCSKIPN